MNGETSAAVLLVENNTTIRKHLIHFSPSLTHVFVAFKVPISIRSTLDVCPGLVQLELVDEDYFYYDDMTMRSRSPKWTKIYGSGGKQQNDASTIYYNLKTLKLGGVKMFSQYLRYFIFSHQFPSLSTLEITEEAVQLTFRTMNAKSSSLENDDNIYVKVSISSSPWIEPILKRSTFGKDLATWFPDNRLKFLDLSICSFKGFKGPSKERIFLALEKLNLETLSIDITPILEKYLSYTRLMAIVLDLHGGKQQQGNCGKKKTYYLDRDDGTKKWKSQIVVEPSTFNAIYGDKARVKRLPTHACIRITLNSVKQVKFYSSKYLYSQTFSI